jgi:hypothetical protein
MTARRDGCFEAPIKLMGDRVIQLENDRNLAPWEIKEIPQRHQWAKELRAAIALINECDKVGELTDHLGSKRDLTASESARIRDRILRARRVHERGKKCAK